jgi:hypothetical protein
MNMGGKHIRQSTKGSWRFLLALLCVLLVVVVGTAQIAHTHADGAVNHADCSLCAAAHATVHIVQTPAPAPPAVVITPLEALPLAATPSARSTFALFTRPPPAV